MPMEPSIAMPMCSHPQIYIHKDISVSLGCEGVLFSGGVALVTFSS